MYAYLSGKFTFKNAAQVYVDVSGVGFEVNISLNTFSAIQHLEEGSLFTWLQVKEDAHTLFGFFEKEEKEMFLMLVGVSGVGASTARMMLSSMRAGEVASAITNGNVRLLESIKGIGKKTAERIVLELRDKAAKVTTGSHSGAPGGNPGEADAITALVSLGIAPKQAELAVKKVLSAEPETTKPEDLIKKALKVI